MRPELKKINDRFIKVMNMCIARKECTNMGDFAKKLKITQSTLTHISQYRQSVTTPILIELRNSFDISVNYILFNEGSEKVLDSENNIEGLLTKALMLIRKR